MATSLDQLRACGTVCVADTGEFNAVKKYKPTDSTTNPSLILNASKGADYAKLIDTAVEWALKRAKAENIKDDDQVVDIALDRLLVEFGCQILKIVPGRVSTEVDAAFSYDKEKTMVKARRLIQLYEELDVSKSRILIKIASTWEGIQAARDLEKEGIHCNLTLLFSEPQAVACAEAGVTLVSPFVGRIRDYYEKKNEWEEGKLDPGVTFVQSVYNRYKHFGYETQIMGASFRDVSEVRDLAGCDYLTMSPSILEQLEESKDKVVKKLSVDKAKTMEIEKKSYLENEADFRKDLKADKQAVVNLADGIRRFDEDAQTLKKILHEKITARRQYIESGGHENAVVKAVKNFFRKMFSS